MQNISVAFEQIDRIEFVLDDDPDLTWIGDFDASRYQRMFVYIDTNVRRIWGDRIEAALARHGQQVFWFEVEPLESSKSLAFYPTALAFLEGEGAGRYDLVVAIGGGIVIDLVSFLVSTYMRGLPFYAIPTTLIGQMDATTAGKTCLNTASAKNVLGTFYYPRVVYNNIRLLETNTEYYLRQGYSETFKYGLLGCPELLELLERRRVDQSAPLLMTMVARAIETRVEIRKRDPLASNLGHTFGHALEKLSDFEVLHGDAISAGTVMALHYALRKGLMTQAVVDEIVEKMIRLNLNTRFDRSISAREMTQLMLRDKKSSSDTMHLVLITDIGKPYMTKGSSFYAADPVDVEAFLEDYIANSPFGVDDCANWLRRDELYQTAGSA
jgi:3-dehydroquinate synthetase